MAEVVIDPARFDAVIFDMDGVLTDTAVVHAAAWAEMFDDYLATRADLPDATRRPFTHEDYLRFVDGRPREDGVVSFLASRGIVLPGEDAGPGEEDAAPGEVSVRALATRKDGLVQDWIARNGVPVFDSTVALLRALRAAGVATGIFSASRHCRHILHAAGLDDAFAARVDGEVAAELGLPGKPDPATLLEVTARLGASPSRTAVVEDAIAGVEAGRRGAFALVIGIDRSGTGAADLLAHGADVVVGDLVAARVGARDAAQDGAPG